MPDERTFACDLRTTGLYAVRAKLAAKNDHVFSYITSHAWKRSTHYVFIAAARAGRPEKTASMSGWGSSGMGFVLGMKTVFAPMLRPNCMSPRVLPTMTDVVKAI